MNIQERNDLVLQCKGLIDRLVLSRRMNIAEQDRDDCRQAGYLAAMSAADTYESAKDRGWEWIPWAKRYIVRDMVRERNRAKDWGAEFGQAIDIEDLLTAAQAGVYADRGINFADEIRIDGTDEQGRSSNVDLSELLPKTNDNNEDFEREILMGSLVEAIYALPRDDRRLITLTLTGRSVSDAGRELDMSQSSADRAYQRILRDLKRALRAGSLPE